MYKKPIIVFEGIEGSGKSFHIKNICKYLRERKLKYLCIREPGGSKYSEIIRKLILNNKSKFNKNTDLLLYLASRSENIETIKSNINKKIIIIDRFTDSTLAYQHYGMGINSKVINYLNEFLLKNIKVNLTFLNVVSLKNMSLRLNKRKRLNRYDKFNKNFYKKVQNGFIKIAKKNPKKYKIIDSNKDISENKEIIINSIKRII